MRILAKDAPATPAPCSSVAGEEDRQRELVTPAETVVPMVLRRVVFSNDLRVNQKLAFEVASDVSVGSDVVFRRGASGVARVKSAKDGGWATENAWLEFAFVTAMEGSRIPVHAALELGVPGATRRARNTLPFGRPFREAVLCAGSRSDVAVDGDQRIRIGAR